MCCKWQARVSRLQTSVAWCRVFPLSVFLFSFIFSLPLFFLWVLLGTFCWTGSLWSLCSRKHEPELETNQCNWLGRAWEIRMLVGLPSRCPGSCPASGQINWLQYDWWHCQTAFRHHLLTNLLKQLNESLPNDSVLYLSICLGLHPWNSGSIFTRISDPPISSSLNTFMTLGSVFRDALWFLYYSCCQFELHFYGFSFDSSAFHCLHFFFCTRQGLAWIVNSTRLSAKHTTISS